MIPKVYRDKAIKIECKGEIEGICYLIPYTGKLKKIAGIDVEQHFIPIINKKGKESLVPISLDKDKCLAFVHQNSYKPYYKDLTAKRILEIRKSYLS